MHTHTYKHTHKHTHALCLTRQSLAATCSMCLPASSPAASQAARSCAAAATPGRQQ